MRRRLSGSAAALLAVLMPVAALAGEPMPSAAKAGDERTVPLSLMMSSLMDSALTAEMRGEGASLDLDALLPPTGPLSRVVLNIAYENSIDILPDRSRLMLALNGRLVAELPLAAFRGPATASITLPPDLIRPGRNRISLMQEAQHRALCNVRGTYDLWSRIHLARSSLTLRSEMPPPTPDLAMLSQLFGASSWAEAPLAILRAGTALGPDHLGWGAIIAQTYALALDGTAPRVTSVLLPARRPAGTEADGGPIPPELVPSPKSVIVGLRDELAGLLDPAIIQDIEGPFLGVYPTGSAPGAFLLVVSGRTPGEVDRATLRLAATHRPLPPQASLLLDDRSLPDPPPARPVAEPGRYRLADLGFASTSHVGYRYTGAVMLRLPADFRPVADRTVALRVNATFEGDLGRGAVLNVRVNGRPASSIDVDRRSSGALERAEMGLPMTLFRSGENRIEIVAELPPEQDTGCLFAVHKPRFTLLDSSELEIPDFARLVGLPDLGATGRTGFPYARADGDGQPRRFDLIVAGGDETWPGAAWTLTAKLAQSAGMLLHPVPSVGWRAPTGRDALIVGPIDDLPPASLDSTALAPEKLANLLEAGTRMSQAMAAGEIPSNEDRARILAQLRGASADTRQPATGGASATVTELPSARWERLAGSATTGESRLLPARLSEFLHDVMARITPGIGGVWSDGSLSDIGDDAYLPDTALLQFEEPDKGSATWTVLTGTDPAIVARATERLVAEPLWSDLGGGAMLWRSGGGDGSTIRAAERYSVLTRPYDPHNILLVTASSLSQRIDVLFFLLLATVVTLTCAVRLLLRTSRRKD